MEDRPARPKAAACSGVTLFRGITSTYEDARICRSKPRRLSTQQLFSLHGLHGTFTGRSFTPPKDSQLGERREGRFYPHPLPNRYPSNRTHTSGAWKTSILRILHPREGLVTPGHPLVSSSVLYRVPSCPSESICAVCSTVFFPTSCPCTSSTVIIILFGPLLCSRGACATRSSASC